MELFDVYPVWDIEPVKGRGCKIWDNNGIEYLDLYGGHAVISIGHSHPVYVEAIKKQVENLGFYSNSVKNSLQKELAEKLGEICGYPDYNLFLCNSGAEANEAALKIARKYGSAKGRSTIISFEHSFHGRTYGAITVTGQEKYHKGFAPMLPDVLYAEFNDLSSVEALASDKTAAIIVEPLQGEGGIIPAEKSFIEGLRSICDKYDALLVFDEVQCGMGRTGKPFCFMHYGIKPDIMTLAKALGGGLPMGAAVAFGKAKDIFSPGDHAATFGGNTASAALAEVVLSKLDELSQNADKMGKYLGAKLDNLKEKYPKLVSDARGLGLMRGLDLTIPPRDVISKCMEKGLLVCSAGYTVLRFVPPLIVTESDIDKAVAIVDAALQEMNV